MLAVFAAIAFVLLVILNVFALILVPNKFSASVALVISAVILAVFEVTLLSSAVILAVFAATLVFNEVMLAVFATTLVFNEVILFVADVILVSNVVIVDELTPPTVFTIGASAVPPKSPANFMTPLILVVASGANEFVMLAATNSVVAS
jgi:hypothetical protein